MAFGSDRLLTPFVGVVSPEGHSRRRSPSHSPRRPEALCSNGLLSPPSSLVRPHPPVSRPPANFPSPVISPASRTGDRPRFDHSPLGRCRHPYAGRSVVCMHPVSSTTALAIIQCRQTWHLHSHRGAERSLWSSKWVCVTTLQCSHNVAAPSVASPLGHRPQLFTGPPGPVHPGFRLASHLLQGAG